jgi:hypothetical protein
MNVSFVASRDDGASDMKDSEICLPQIEGGQSLEEVDDLPIRT